MELRALNDNEMKISGYAITFNQPTVLFEMNGIEYKEVIDSRALNSTPLNDVLLRYNHNVTTTPLARTRGGSLKLNIDNKGLFFEATLFNTQSARDIYTLVKERGLDKMSFGFIAGEDNYDKKTNTRMINKIDKLFEISIVDQPAYDSTSVEARGFFENIVNKEKSEREKILRQLYIKTLGK